MRESSTLLVQCELLPYGKAAEGTLTKGCMVGPKRGSIRTVPYDVKWKYLFEEEAVRLRLLPGIKVLRIEHVGSTAIPGMEARPIIDIVAFVQSLDDVENALGVIENRGYTLRTRSPGSLSFARGVAGSRTHYISFTTEDNESLLQHIMFRDILLSSPSLVKEYRDLKQELSQDEFFTKERYNEAKKRFLARVIEGAGLLSVDAPRVINE